MLGIFWGHPHGGADMKRNLQLVFIKVENNFTLTSRAFCALLGTKLLQSYRVTTNFKRSFPGLFLDIFTDRWAGVTGTHHAIHHLSFEVWFKGYAVCSHNNVFLCADWSQHDSNTLQMYKNTLFLIYEQHNNDLSSHFLSNCLLLLVFFQSGFVWTLYSSLHLLRTTRAPCLKMLCK